LLTRLNETVYMIDTQALGRPNAVAAYVITGKETALIDMGYQSSSDTIIADLTKHGINSSDLDYLLPTHVHLDHSGSLGTLARRYPNASIHVHPKGRRHLVDPSSLWSAVEDLFGQEVAHKFGQPLPVDEERLRNAPDGGSVDLGGRTCLRAYWTPGHASHHLSYEWEGHHAFFTGDAVGVYFPDFPTLIPTTPPTSFNLEQMLESLELILSASPLKFYTPHFGTVGDATGFVNENMAVLGRWKSNIERMGQDELSVDQMAGFLTEDACRRLSLVASEVPNYVRMVIRNSVLGFRRYLEL
jgi:glyoxylase-like metal-dependent hydrolase (beta-lactamase superfamily II)